MVDDASVLDRPAPGPDRTVRWGDRPEDVADVWPGTPDRPLLVVLHGGFWRPAYDRTHLRPMAAALRSAGWTVVTPEYRRLPGDPDASTADVREALTALPGQVGGHDGTVVLAGHSAGGHLALWAAATCPPSQLLRTVALAPVADLAQADALGTGGGAVRAFLGAPAPSRPDLDPVRLPDPQAPVVLVHGADDAVVPPALAAAYRDAHPAARLRLLPGTGHYGPIDPWSAAWSAVVAALAGEPAP